MSEKHDFPGFLISKCETSKLVEVGCFNPFNSYRWTIKAFSEQANQFEKGDFVSVRELKDGQLELKLPPTTLLRIKVIREEDRVFYKLKNAHVEENDISHQKRFHHNVLGEINDPKECIRSVKSIYFEVRATRSGFELIALDYNEKRKEIAIRSQMSKMKKYSEKIQEENNHLKACATETWRKVGHLRLIAINYEDALSEAQFVFSLRNLNYSDQFHNLIHRAWIVLIKQVNDVGTWSDDGKVPKLQGTALRMDDPFKTTVIVRTANKRIATVYNLDDMFRVEANHPGNTLNFWSNQEFHLSSSHLFKSVFQVVNSRVLLQRELNMQEDIAVSPATMSQNQKKAVEMALNPSRRVVVIQGAAGTGKTFCLAQFIMNFVFRRTNNFEFFEKKLIVLTPTQSSCMTIYNAALRECSRKYLPADALLESDDYYKLLRKIPADVEEQIQNWEELVESGRMTPKEMDEKRDAIMKDVGLQNTKEILDGVCVFFAVIDSPCLKHVTRNSGFRKATIVIDDIGHMRETATWPVICKMGRLVLAGDLYQLPPFVAKQELRAADSGIGDSLLDRILPMKDQFSWIVLDKQYRCHPQIFEWSQKTYYREVEWRSRITDELLQPAKEGFEEIYGPLVFFDTSLPFYPECVDYFECLVNIDVSVSDKSYTNPGEARTAIEHYLNLRRNGVTASEVVIMTPYRAQRDLIRKLIDERLARETNKVFPLVDKSTVIITTPDATVGQEFEAVVFSLVRSNPKLHLGFFDELRFNVALTRAKYHFALIGNGFMLANSKCENPNRVTAKSRPGAVKNFYNSILFNHRFPPCYAFGKETEYKKEFSKNNFGLNFCFFREHCKNWPDNGEMYEHCIQYGERNNDEPQQKMSRKRKADF